MPKPHLKVIGAGLGRTGTTSLKRALEYLLDGPCFHFLEYGPHPELMWPWLDFVNTYDRYDAADGKFSIPENTWNGLLPGYVACIDEPGSYYWRQLCEAFPNAVVILSVRDSRSWFESMSHIHKVVLDEAGNPELLSDHRKEFLRFLQDMYPGLSADLDADSEMAFFESHNNKVIKHAERNPEFAERFVVWEAKQGWAPICQVLGLPVPDIPFPHLNQRSEYHGY